MYSPYPLHGNHRASAARPGATRMAARRSCVNSLWSGTERVRISERLKATLAGVMELEVLRCKHLDMVDAALEDRGPAAANADAPGPAEESGTPESDANRGSATSRRQQVSRGSQHDQIVKYECRDDVHLPTNQPPLRLSRQIFFTAAWWRLAAPSAQPSQMVPEIIRARSPIILHSVSASVTLC